MPNKKPQANRNAVSKARAKGKLMSPKEPLKSAKDTVFQLKITLKDIRPPVWREIQTKDCTLGRLHDLIQAAMGWYDCHLHEFEVGEDRYGDPAQGQDSFWGDEPEVGNEKKVKLSQLARAGIKNFAYVYDMGDSWEHIIQIQKAAAAEPGVAYPRCTGGERACPPEDCGGPWGYGDLVAAIQNPTHKRHDELLDWLDGEFDPEKFDVATANSMLTGAG